MPVDKLLQWAKNRGVVLTNVKFENTKNQGWGAFPIESGITSSIHLPIDTIITPEIAQSVIKKDISSIILMKTLVGLWKSSTGDPFKPYFDLLPSLEEIGSPLTLNENELNVYKGTNLNKEAIKGKLKSLESDWEMVKDIIEFSDFLFGHLIISSRAFPLNIIDSNANEDEVMLLPLVDLLNHKPRALVDWKGNNGFTLETISNNVSGQLWNNYGPKGNEELLMGYGFVIEDNEFDLLHLTLNLKEDLIHKVTNLGIELTKFNDYTTHERGNGEIGRDGIVFIVNNFHPLPKGLIECFALSSPNEQSLTLANTLNGIQDLKSMLKLKFKGSLDILPKKPEGMDELKYQTAGVYRKGQLKMYNLLMQSIKELERSLLKFHKKRLSKIKEEENEINENNNNHLLYIREGKSPLLIDNICINSNDWYN